MVITSEIGCRTGTVRGQAKKNNVSIPRKTGKSTIVTHGTIRVNLYVDLFHMIIFSKMFQFTAETERKTQETGKKLQVLMDAVNTCCTDCPCIPNPIPPNTTTSAWPLVIQFTKW